MGHKFVDELRGKDLSKKDWAILMIDGIRLSKDQLAVVAEEVVGELTSLLKPINAEALISLEEAGDELNALQSLDVPNTLHRNLLSTNAIENSFLNTRRKIGPRCLIKSATLVK